VGTVSRSFEYLNNVLWLQDRLEYFIRTCPDLDSGQSLVERLFRILKKSV